VSSTLRVVLDTNVAVSALLFTQGRLASIRLAWQNRILIPLVSAATTTELIRVLSYPKFKLMAKDQRELLADYLPYCATIRTPQKAPKTPVCPDPHDIPFLQLAIAGKADHLVTGDADLLGLTGTFRRSIITPADLVAILEHRLSRH